MKSFFAAYKFYFLEYVRAKSFLVTLAFLCGGIVLLSVITGLTSDGEKKSNVIVINESTYKMEETILNKNEENIQFKLESDEQAAYKKVKNRDADVLLVVTETEGVPTVKETTLTMHSGMANTILQSYIQNQYVQKIIKEEGVSQEVVQKLITPPIVEQQIIQDTSKSFGIVYVFVFLMYMFIIMYGQQIGTSVATEKSTRVMEFMISKVSPVKLMYAKILSVFSTALIQIGAIFLTTWICLQTGLLNDSALQMMKNFIDINSITPTVIIMFLVYFSLGYLVYALLYAAAGAMVSRVEDLNGVISPIMLLIIGAFFIGMYSLSNPTATIVQVGSFVPFFSPIVTFSRIVAGVAPIWEIIGTIVLLSGTIALCNHFISRVYVNGVMTYTDKVSWRQIKQFFYKA